MKRALCLVAFAVLPACSSGTTSRWFHFDNAPSSVKAGTPLHFNLTAYKNGSIDTGYSGTVHFTSTDRAASLPADYTFVGSDQGSHAFTATLNTAGSQSIHALDATANVDSAKAISVTGGSLSDGGGGGTSLVTVSGVDQTGQVGTVLAQPLVVEATDSAGNPVPGVAITWAASDPQAQVVSQVGTTGADGTASATVQLGNAVGAETFTATAAAVSGSPAATFNETVTAPPLTLTSVSGDGQTNTDGTALGNPLVVGVADSSGNPVANVTVSWSALAGGGSVAAATSASDASGHASIQATLGMAPGSNTFQASIAGAQGSPVTFTATGVNGLAYTDPAAGGMIRLVRNSASTPTTAVLDLVAAQALTGFSVAMNLPVDPTRAQLDATPMVPGSALNPGTNPPAVAALLPSQGPLAGVLVSGQSQKAAGNGSSPGDASIPAGTVLYTLQLDEKTGATPGTIFDGTQQLPPKFRAALRDHLGNDVVPSSQFAIGKLEAR